MKYILKNQKGYTLILVLLIITIIGIMMVPLFGSVLNNAQQNNKTEESIQLDSVSKMGVAYFQNHVRILEKELKVILQDELKKEVNKLYQPTKAEIEEVKNVFIGKFTEKNRNDFEEYLNSWNIAEMSYIKDRNNLDKDKLRIPIPIIVDLPGKEEQFQFSIEEIKVGPVEDNQFKITFDSIPSNSNGKGEPLHSEIIVSFGTFIPNEEGNNNQNIPGCDGNNIITEKESKTIGSNSKEENVTYNQSLCINGDLNLMGKAENKETVLTVNNGDLIVTGTLTMYQHTEIVVYGNVYLNDLKSHNKHATISYTGNVYVNGSIYINDNKDGFSGNLIKINKTKQ